MYMASKSMTFCQESVGYWGAGVASSNPPRACARKAGGRSKGFRPIGRKR